MKLENVKKTKTSDVIFKWLAGCKPISDTTNIMTFKDYLSKKHSIDDKEFFDTFDELEDSEAGYFSSAEPHIFHWEYNLNDVAEKILNPTKPLNIRKFQERAPKRKIVEAPLKRRPGRPKGAKNRPKLQEQRREKEIIFIYTTKKGDKIPLSLNEIDDLVSQSNIIKKAIT